MIFVEYMFVFDTKADQTIDSEKSPVIDLMIRPLPMRKRIVLLVQQQIEFFLIIIDARNDLPEQVAVGIRVAPPS